MSREVFADTCFWIALTNPKDDLHESARATRESLADSRLVTSELVLNEYLNYFAERGKHLREAASKLVAHIVQDETTVFVVHQTHEQFDAARDLYAKRPDKAWSHTDCTCMEIMRERGIREALTDDHHFEQAGFNALLSSTHS